MTESERELLTMPLPAGAARLETRHLLSSLWKRQDEKNFHEVFDNTLLEIAALNSEVFSVRTIGGARIPLFDQVTQIVTDPSERAPFAKALINKLISFSFEHIFAEGFDFYSTLFEYLIKDYNSDAGGKYAEYPFASTFEL